jgi:alkanesulfonate monooxygenase SsuD/methylene tetrahydromethanopterin reductase-like flavin-dependent oxidoreductase (luciferase family)
MRTAAMIGRPMAWASNAPGEAVMKFSLIYEAQTVDTSPAAEQQMFRDIVAQCLLAEELDFDCVWAVEHTALPQYAHMSAPETFLAFLAGRTSRIHVGHGVICLPPAMNHPIKVAQRIAMLDILSEGRLHFGMGKGGTQQEAGAFGYQLDVLQPMIDEAMYLIPRILTEEFVEHDGEYVQIPRRPIHPKPFQSPHPPLYMACTRPDAVRTAAARGIGALVLGFGGPEDIAVKAALYQEAWEARRAEDQVGFRPTRHLAALCPAIVLDDRDRARRVGLRGQRFFVESLGHWYNGGPPPTTDDLDAEENAEVLGSYAQRVAQISQETISSGPKFYGSSSVAEDSYGSVDDCISYVGRLIDAGADEILFLVQMGTVPHAASMETIRNIGEHVIPHFRARADAPALAEA